MPLLLACKNTKTQTKSGFDREKIISEESAANLYYAWLLVLHTMLEHEAKTPEEVQRLWNAADQTVIQEYISNWRLMEAAKIMGYGQPYLTLGFRNVRSEAELAIYK